jgi:hypothetical protein
VQYLPKPKKKATRSTKLKQIAEDYKYGKGGRGYTYRHCFDLSKVKCEAL